MLFGRYTILTAPCAGFSGHIYDLWDNAKGETILSSDSLSYLKEHKKALEEQKKSS